jgi:hypothetical protein
MRDRTVRQPEEVFLQRTAGPYIWVNLDRVGSGGMSIHVRYSSNSDRPSCISAPMTHPWGSDFFGRNWPSFTCYS